MSFPSQNTSDPSSPSTESFVISGAALTGTTPFVDRRSPQPPRQTGERRQFGSSHAGLSEAGRELAVAIDQYKLEHHRRYITCDEMLGVLEQLGYRRVVEASLDAI